MNHLEPIRKMVVSPTSFSSENRSSQNFSDKHLGWRNHRSFLAIALILSLLFAACGGGTPADAPVVEESAAESADESMANVPDTQHSESPMLAQRVAAGELPNVDERLPTDPVVIEPIEAAGETIGQYGGTLSVMGIDPNGDAFGAEWGDGGGLGQESAATWDIALRKAVPNIADSWELSEDLMTLTIHIREGLRWSDGELLTTKDVQFWWEDIMLHDKLTPKIPSYFAPNDQVMTVNIIDDYTFAFEYVEPYVAAADRISSLRPWAPEHYLSQWHIDHNENANDLAAEEGFGEWWEAFLARYGGSGIPGPHIVYGGQLPVLAPYIVGEADSAGNRIAERNPYYWKVDSAGNQLPYIDFYERVLVGSREILEAKAVSGEYNFGGAWADLANFPLLVESSEQAGYTVRMYPGLLWGGSVSWAFNYTSKDPLKREIFNDLRFRKAMAYAINRDEYSQVFNLGLTELRNAAPPSDWSFYEDSQGRLYVEYDVDLANELLDELGLAWDANQEWRLRPDNGEQFIITTEIGQEGHRPGEWEFITRYWAEVGIEVKFKQVDQQLYAQHLLANDLDIGTWGAGGPPETVSHAVYPIRLVPPWHWRDCCALAGIPWYDWYDSNGEKGEEPPEIIKELYTILDEWKAEPIGSDRYVELGKEMVRINNENIWYNVATGSTPSISHAVVVSAVDNSVKNVRDPESGTGWWLIEMLWIDE
ncbi:ABC transporter substrate-binding protein [Chloroflexi bacterium TSY]|nr:ABC transporter substrate-binding protein [Chloroflexi bacterium TSY]